MIPDYQTLMRPVLECAQSGEANINDVVQVLAGKLGLSPAETAEMLPSGRQTRFANRVHWAKSYLKHAGLVEATRRGYFTITPDGLNALADREAIINNAYLEKYAAYQEFKQRSKPEDGEVDIVSLVSGQSSTPDEELREAHARIVSALATDLLDKVRAATPAFFEKLIITLLLAMGYGGSSDEAGRALGQSGDGGIDGVIDQDPLGVDQIYIQAKRYSETNTVGPGAIREFFGALSIKRAGKGIFVTTSTFTSSAIQTARELGGRIVLIDGMQLARLMVRYNVGCREEEVLSLKRLDEDFFEV